MSSTHSYPLAKCAACGWLHVAMPAADARKAVADFNAARERGNWPDRPATYERYVRCHRCGASTDQFVPAVESDARHGATLHGCVVEREYDKLEAAPPSTDADIRDDRSKPREFNQPVAWQ